MGDKNIAKIATVALGVADKERLREILEDIATKLSTVSPSAENDDLREVALEAAAEIAKPKTNWTRLKGLVPILLAGIEGITAMKDLYDLLLPFLPAIGVNIA